jgi:hypothetical protein
MAVLYHFTVEMNMEVFVKFNLNMQSMNESKNWSLIWNVPVRQSILCFIQKGWYY